MDTDEDGARNQDPLANHLAETLEITGIEKMDGDAVEPRFARWNNWWKN
jgi:hypothetical protein